VTSARRGRAALLSREHRASGRRLWEEHRTVHPDGYGYSRCCEFYQRQQFAARLSGAGLMAQPLPAAIILRRAVPHVHRVSSYAWMHTGNLERGRLKSAVETARNCRAFFHAQKSRHRDRTAWLGWSDSNCGIRWDRSPPVLPGNFSRFGRNGAAETVRAASEHARSII
jgi:hypothetical protein